MAEQKIMVRCAGSYAVEEAATMCNWFHTVHDIIPACEIRIVFAGYKPW